MNDAKPASALPAKSPGYWAEAWRRYRKKYLPLLALIYVLALGLVAIASPMIIGAKPIVCKYKGQLYFPCVGYYNERWENPIFIKDRFRNRYYESLKEKDPESWAIWPLIYQDPGRRLRTGEWPDQPENPVGVKGSPNKYNKLGTTSKGVDVLAHLIHGTRSALLVGFVSMGIASVIGITLGAMAGYYGGWADTILSRLIEIVMCLPTLAIILALISIIEKPTIWHTMAVIGATGWTGIARLTRGEFLKLRNVEYVTAARALGAGQFRVMFRHILPNALAPVLVPITFGVASAILLENALRFLGLGDTSTASWGALLNEGQRNLTMWWLIVFPGAAIFFTVLAYNLIGEGLQEATDPRLREGSK
jgi:peptide/nickel transport system permease protein